MKKVILVIAVALVAILAYFNLSYKTFRNEAFGFSFKYPRNLSVEEIVVENHPEAADAENYWALSEFVVGRGTPEAVRLVVYRTNYENINAWVENNLLYHTQSAEITDLQVAGRPAKKFKTCDGEGWLGTMVWISTSVWKEAKVYEFQATPRDCNEADPSTYHKIISTFKLH